MWIIDSKLSIRLKEAARLYDIAIAQISVDGPSGVPNSTSAQYKTPLPIPYTSDWEPTILYVI